MVSSEDREDASIEYDSDLSDTNSDRRISDYHQDILNYLQLVEYLDSRRNRIFVLRKLAQPAQNSHNGTRTRGTDNASTIN